MECSFGILKYSVYIYNYLQQSKEHNLLDLYDLKLSRLVDCLVRLISGSVVKESVDDFLRVQFLGELYK